MALVVAATAVDRGSQDSAVLGASRPSAEVGGHGDLADLGPVDLIHLAYLDQIVFDCSTHILRGDITIDDVMVSPGSTVLTSATFQTVGGSYWANIGSHFDSGTASVQFWSFSGGGCSVENNPAGFVYLEASNGDHYVVTIIANPI